MNILDNVTLLWSGRLGTWTRGVLISLMPYVSKEYSIDMQVVLNIDYVCHFQVICTESSQHDSETRYFFSLFNVCYYRQLLPLNNLC